MSFVAAAGAVGAWAGIGAATSTAAIIGGGAMIGAGVGGAYSALTGDGKILDSMLTGATLGGLGGWGLAAAGVGGAAGAAGAGGAGGAGAVGAGGTAGTIAGAAETAAASSPALAAYGPPTSAMMPGAYDVGTAADAMFAMPQAPSVVEPFVGPPDSAKLGFFERLTPKEMLGYGLGATTLMGLLGNEQKGVNVPVDKGTIRPYEYSTARREPEAGKPYYFEPVQYDKYGKTIGPLDTSERNYFTQGYKALPTYKAAVGGQVPRYEQMAPGGLAAIQGMRDGYSPMTTGIGEIPQYAGGGQLGGYSDGGQLLKGPGDGVSDSIPASINNKQPARLADGEFVIPARIVSELGNGSTDAGAKRLYDMMDRIQNARKKTVGKGKVAVDSKAKKHLPA